MRTIRAFLAAAFVGLVLGFGWQCFHPLYEGQFPATASGVWQALHAINWLAVWFTAFFLGLAGATFGFFLTGPPSEGVQTFSTVTGLWDLLTCWWR